ncbi:hypothetical protein NRA30_13315 [Acinetobacter baumannii]|nr:hypothetical protein [Acinetobacter baumannii]
MKPEQFIREQGLDKAREVVEGAPDWAKSYYEPTGQYQDQEWSDEMSVGIEDLEHIVESLDRYRKATEAEKQIGHRIDCEVLDKPENHISPNCKVTEVHINEAYKLNRLG